MEKESYIPTEKEMKEKYVGYGEPFEFEYSLSEGGKIEAKKQEDKTVQITIENKDGEKFDFASLLPPDYVFASFDYVAELSEKTGEEIVWVPWFCDHKHKLITIGEFGDFKDHRDILGVLHEIGHARKNTPEELKALQEAEEEFCHADNKTDRALWAAEEARILSKMERKALAYAIKTLRNILKKLGLSIKEFFDSPSEMLKYVKDDLKSYKENYEWIEEEDEEFNEELGRLFDKNLK